MTGSKKALQISITFMHLTDVFIQSD